jgi:hypothetical protein
VYPHHCFKLIPLLVSVALPAHSHAIASPRGVKRSRTPDHMGNGHAEGGQDDGTWGSGKTFLMGSIQNHAIFPALAPCLVTASILHEMDANIAFVF